MTGPDSGADHLRPHAEHLTGAQVLAALGVELDALMDEVASPITARRPWLQCWVDANPDVEPWAITLRTEDGRLDGVALLGRSRQRGIHRITALGHGFSDRSRPLVARTPPAAEALARAVAEAVSARRPWSFVLEQLPVDDPVATRLESLLPRASLVPGDGCPVLHIDDRNPRSYSTKKTRRDVTQGRKRLAEEGLDLEIAYLDKPDEVVDAIPLVIDLRRQRDHALGRRSHLDDPRQREFYLEVVRAHAEDGLVELIIVRIGGVPAAFDLAFCDGSAYRLWDGRIASDFARFSPGHLSREALLERVVPDPVFTELDWMRGEQSYKRQLATSVEPTALLQAYSSPAVRTFTELPRRTRTLVARVRDSHPIFKQGLEVVKRYTVLRGVNRA